MHESFLDKLQSINEREIRIHLMREAFESWNPSATARLLAAIIERCLMGIAPGEDAQLALLPYLLDLKADEEGYDRLRDIYLAAAELRQSEEESEDREQRYAIAARLLLDPPPHKKPPERVFKFGPKWDRDVTLGERKMMASGSNRVYLQKLVYDGDHRVVERLCANPRVQEQDIMTIATRRPNSPAVLDAIARSSWLSRYAIRRALALNPYAATGTVIRLLPLLHGPHLASVRHVGDLHPMAQEMAGLMADWRNTLLKPSA